MNRAFYRSHTTPFDAAGALRRKQMGLLLPNGKPNEAAVDVVAHVYAGLFYGYLCEVLPDKASVDNACRELFERAGIQNAPQKVLTLCRAYDDNYLRLPETMWWISGDLVLATVFVDKYFAWIRVFIEEMEVK